MSEQNEGKFHPGESVIRSAEELLKFEHASMTVETFQRYWVDRFWTGDESVTWDWVRKISGNHFRRVDLVQGGKKVGEVPPLAKYDEFLSTGTGPNSLPEQFATVQNQIKRLPQHGERMMRNLIQRLIPGGKEPDPAILAEWDQLFKAFGYEGLLTDEEVKESEDTGSLSSEGPSLDDLEEL